MGRSSLGRGGRDFCWASSKFVRVWCGGGRRRQSGSPGYVWGWLGNALRLRILGFGDYNEWAIRGAEGMNGRITFGEIQFTWVKDS